MADIDIKVSAQDDASAKFRAIGKALSDGMKEADTATKNQTDTNEKSTKAWLTKAAAIAAVTIAAKKFYDLSKAALKDYAEEELSITKVSAALKQMGYNASQLLPQLEAQTAAFERSTMATDNQVRGMQQLMLRFGVAPKDIQSTTQAVLDYAAATGTDAESATMTLLRAVENGGRGLGRMGVSIEETGDKTKDLNAAIAEMERKFGGAAAAASGTLAGQLDQLKKAQDRLSESFGGFLAKTGIAKAVIEGATTALEALTEVVTGDQAAANEKYRQQVEAVESATERLRAKVKAVEQAEKQLAEARTQSNNPGFLKMFEDRIVKAKEEVRLQDQLITKLRERQREEGGESISTVVSSTAGADKKEARERELEGFRKHLEKTERLHERFRDSHREEENEAADKRARDMKKWHEREAKEIEKQAREKEALYEALGVSLGSAIASGIESALAGDGGDWFGDLLIGLAQLGAEAIGTSIGGPVAGKIASSVVGGVGRGIQRNGQRQHIGGPTWGDGLPRFHEGGEVPAILQHGEHVLSRTDVSNMGGHEGVEAAKRGQGAGATTINLTVQAMDSASFEDWIAGPGGAALVRLMRHNRGEFVRELRAL